MPRGRSRGKVASVLPKSVAVASTEGDLASVTEWLKSKPDLEAKAVVEISVGDEVKAKFHGGAEWYNATILEVNEEDETFDLEFKETGTTVVWGEYTDCPR